MSYAQNLLVALVVLVLFSQPACSQLSARWQNLSAWVTGCMSPPQQQSALQLGAVLQFASAQVSLRQASNSLQQAACVQNGAPIIAMLQVALVQAPAGGSCQIFSNSSQLSAFFGAVETFMCQSPSQSGSPCAATVVSLLQQAGLPTTLIDLLDPELSYSGDNLSRTCQALSQSTGCCFRSWSLLMSALARQLCLEQLAMEYFNLPGRCEMLSDSPVVGPCSQSWQAELSTLLTSPRPGSCTASVQQLALRWLSGASCTTQGSSQACFTSACDLWCHYRDTYNAYLTDSDTAGLSPVSPPAAGSPQDSDNNKLSKQVKDFVIAFSVLVFCCLLAFLVWLYWELVHTGGDAPKSTLPVSLPAPVVAAYAAQDPATPRYSAGARATQRGPDMQPRGTTVAVAEATAPARFGPTAEQAGGVQGAQDDDDARSFVTAQESVYGSAQASSATPSFTTARESASGSSQSPGSNGLLGALWRRTRR